MGAQSHRWVIAHLLDIPNQSYLWKAGGFVVLVQITKPILLMLPYSEAGSCSTMDLAPQSLSRDNPTESYEHPCSMSAGCPQAYSEMSDLSPV